ncbi:TIR domain-containing protein [Bacillus cereus group sp. RP32]|uniref:toll/interleukin-1 receptor domain-containing protein n=1 Tax=Bacillus cereus group sp. RP32 TaxID=3040258 RepID=UPI003390B381
MLDVTKIQSIIEKLQKEKYDIHSSLVSVLRIARQRLDIKEVLFLEYSNTEFLEANTRAIVSKIKTLADKTGISGRDYGRMVKETHMLYIDARKCDVYDFSKKEIVHDQLLTAPLPGLISEIENYQRLLASNVIPSGLHPQDLYFTNLEKNKLDAIYNHQITVITNTLNNTKLFMLNYLMDLEEILNTTEGNKQMSTQQTLSIDNKIDKIFISHASKDVKYVKELVDLLNDIGVQKTSKSIFCSSLPGYDIPHGESIYEFLKNELNNNNIMVLFVLSDNYYQSAPCLNEMGAAWITSKKYTTVLTPNFKFEQIVGAIDPTKISFKMNDPVGLDKFRDSIIQTLELEDTDYKIWQEDKAKYLSTVSTLADQEASTQNVSIELERVKNQGEDAVELSLRFINVTTQVIEFRYIEIELTDENGEKLEIVIEEDETLNDMQLMSKENKVIKKIFPYDSSSTFRVRRIVNEKTKINFAIV